MTPPLFSRNLCKILSLTLLPLVVLGCAMSPVSAAPDKPAKSSKAAKGKKKAKKKGKKAKKAKKVANAAKKAGQEKKKAGGDVLIADAKTPFDKLFNQAIQWVQEGTYGPDDIRVNGKSLFEYAASRGQLAAMKLLVDAGSETSAFRSCAAAISSGNVECVKYMQELGIPLCNPGERGSVKSTLLQATFSGNPDCVAYVYEQLRPFILEGFKNIHRAGYLRYAALECGKLEIVKFWEEKGIRPQENDILFASASGSMELLSTLRDKAEAIDYKKKGTSWDVGGVGYVMMAARSGNLDAVKYFVEKGAPVQAAPDERCADVHMSDLSLSPILMAALSGSLECVKYLEEKGAPHIGLKEGLGLLEAAASSGNLELVKYLAKKEETKERMSYALCLAAYRGYTDIVKYLVEECSVDVNTPGIARTVIRSSMNWYYDTRVESERDTPLSFAAKSGDLSLVKYLIDKGADINAVQKGFNRYWDSSALVAASYGQPHVLKFLLKKASFASEEDKNHLFMRAAKGCSLACLKLIFEEKVDVNAEIGEYKWRAFGEACGSSNPGRMACIKFLLKKGSKVQPKDVVSAAFSGNYDCLPMLYAQNVKTPQVDDSQPILQRAAAAGRVDALKLMEENGLPTDSSKDSNSGSALREAVLAACVYMIPGHLECIRYLTSKGLRLDKDELDKLLAGKVLFGDHYAPEPLRKVLQETHQ